MRFFSIELICNRNNFFVFSKTSCYIRQLKPLGLKVLRRLAKCNSIFNVAFGIGFTNKLGCYFGIVWLLPRKRTGVVLVVGPDQIMGDALYA